MPPEYSIERLTCAIASRLDVWVPRTSSTSHDQAILVDQTTDASVSSDAVLPKIDWFGQRFQRCRCVQGTVRPVPASSLWILRYPRSGFSRASRRTRALMVRQVAGRRVLPRLDLAAQGAGGYRGASAGLCPV